MKSALQKRQRQRHRGAALVEVLVAFLLLSLGLLGMSALQVKALQNSHSALQRSQATKLAHFKLDAMRANAAAARTGGYNLGAPGAPVCAVPGESSLPTHDQRAWMLAKRNILGEVDSTCGMVLCAAVSGGTQCTVQVFWDDTRGTGGTAAQMVEIRSLL
jgi:type IV pilus assembly protein PilV